MSTGYCNITYSGLKRSKTKGILDKGQLTPAKEAGWGLKNRQQQCNYHKHWYSNATVTK